MKKESETPNSAERNMLRNVAQFGAARACGEARARQGMLAAGGEVARVHEPGELVRDRYTIVDVIGRGGVSTTYAARDEASNRQVALKQLLIWHQHDWKVLELFEREARVLSTLAHPNIPRYLDHFTVESAEGPTFYIAQEIAPGTTLAALAPAGQRPAEQAVRQIVDQLLEVLEYLQSRNPPIIHRDIKPANVILDANQRPYLVDFGAVRDTYRSTVQGSTIVGTFGYMAPEQFYGSAVPATDVYGVAATAVFLLTGLGPDQLPRRRGRPDFRKRARVSRGLSAWLDRALAPEVSDRFPTARAARDALARAGREGWRSVVRVGLATFLLAALVVPVAVAATLIWSGRAIRAPWAGPGTSNPAPIGETTATAWPRVKRGRMVYVQALVGHYAGITDFHFLPDGQRAVTAAADGTVKLWTFQTGRLLRTFELPEKRRVFNCSLSRDGKLLAAAVPSLVRVWNLETGEVVREVRAKVGGSSFVALSPDGNVLAVGRLSGGVEVHVGNTGEPLVLDQPKKVLSVVISPDGKLLAAAGEPTIRVWKLPSGQPEKTFRGSDRDVSEIAFSPNGEVLASAADDKALRVFSFTPPDVYRTVQGFDDEVWSLAIGSDNKTLIGGSKDGVVNLYDFISQELIESVKSPSPKIVAVAISPDLRYVASGSAEGDALIYALREPPWTPPPIDAPVARAERVFPKDISEQALLCLRGEALMDDGEGGGPAREARALFEKARALEKATRPPTQAWPVRSTCSDSSSAGSSTPPTWSVPTRRRTRPSSSTRGLRWATSGRVTPSSIRATSPKRASKPSERAPWTRSTGGSSCWSWTLPTTKVGTTKPCSTRARCTKAATTRGSARRSMLSCQASTPGFTSGMLPSELTIRA